MVDVTKKYTTPGGDEVVIATGTYDMSRALNAAQDGDDIEIRAEPSVTTSEVEHDGSRGTSDERSSAPT